MNYYATTTRKGWKCFPRSLLLLLLVHNSISTREKGVGNVKERKVVRRSEESITCKNPRFQMTSSFVEAF